MSRGKCVTKMPLLGARHSCSGLNWPFSQFSQVKAHSWTFPAALATRAGQPCSWYQKDTPPFHHRDRSHGNSPAKTVGNKYRTTGLGLVLHQMATTSEPSRSTPVRDWGACPARFSCPLCSHPGLCLVSSPCPSILLRLGSADTSPPPECALEARVK